MFKKSKIIIGLILVILIVGIILLINPSNQKENLEQANEAPIKLQVGGHNTIVGVILETAKDKGFFTEQNLDVDIKKVESSKISMAGLENGELDIVIASNSAGTFNYLAKDEKIRIIADAGRFSPVVVIRKNLTDSIKTLSDLKGVNFATPRAGSSSQYAFAKILEKVNLSLDDITSKYLKQQEIIVALETNNLEAGIIADPYATLAVDKGIGIKFAQNEIKKIFPKGQQYAVLLSTTDTLTDKANTIHKFFLAYQKATDYYNKAKRGEQPEKDEVVRIISSYTEIEPEIVNKITWINIATDLKPDIAYMEETQNWYLENNLLEQKIDLNEKTNFNFLPH